jgi:peroxiredoxin
VPFDFEAHTQMSLSPPNRSLEPPAVRTVILQKLGIISPVSYIYRMKKLLCLFSHCSIPLGILVVLAVGNLFAQSGTNSVAPMNKDFVKTNGQYVIIGNMMYDTNSPLNTVEFKQYMWRVYQLMKIGNSGASNATDLLVEGAWGLINDYPHRANGYQDIMAATEDYDYDGKPNQGRALASELAANSAPKEYKDWAKGFLNRLDSRGKPMSLQFTAVDGRSVDLSKLKGKVVLVDFWATTCGPCVKELPRVKAAFEKFQSRGFEVVGISCDTDKEQLLRYVKQHDMLWPQYFDGKQQEDNKFTVEFGIDGIPHMFLVDKKGLLRFDNVRASNKYHAKNDTISFEEKITGLLAEK